MRGWAKRLQISVGLALLLAVCGFAPDAAQQVGADFIVTAAPAYKPLAQLSGRERFPKGAQLLLVHDGKAEPLVKGFAASADADVYFDGKLVLFAGKKQAGDPWQIWEVNLADRSVRRVVTTKSDAERPLYLPGGRLVWAQRTARGFVIESSEDGHPMKWIPLNPTAGPGILRLTYVHTSTFPVRVVRDGRILFESGFPLGEGHTPELYLVYADGSGVEAYRCDHGRARWGGTQLKSGDLVFTHGSSLARFTSALAHEAPIAAPKAEYAGSMAETDSGAWLLSARTASHYSIRLWKPGAATLKPVLAERGEDLVEPVLVAPRKAPPRFPSGLHPWSYANMLSIDARLSRDGLLKGTPAKVRLEQEEENGKTADLGTAPVEKDGSFFVKVPGEKPIRFVLLNDKGQVLRRPRGWFWIRGGEQRICVGCHTGPERSWDNRVPDVLRRTTTPVDLTGADKANTAHEAGGSEE